MAPKPSAAGRSTLDRLSTGAKAAVGLLFVVLFAVLYFVVFFGEIDTEITAALQLEQSLKNELSQAELSKTAYNKDLAEKTHREQLAREQKKILPDEAETPAFLSALQGVATVSGVKLTSWSPTEEVAEEFFAKVPMKLTLSGHFHQVAKFFHGVGQLDRIINVENIQIKSTKKAESEGVEVEVECLATAFRSVQAGEASSRRRGGGR